MGHKKVCLECRLVLNRPFDKGAESLLYTCPSCGKKMILLPHRFRPPKKSDDKKWATVSFYIEHGFLYQHIYANNSPFRTSRTEYVKYPEDLQGAKEFVEKYKDQAIKK